MRKSLYVVTLSALLIMTLLAGCYSEEALAERTIPTKGSETQTVSTEASSSVVEENPIEVKEQKTVAEAKPAETKEQKTVAEVKPAETKRQKPVNETKPVQAKEQKPATTEAKPAETNRISRDEARIKAITHANVENGKIRDFDIELEKERGVTFYEISFDVGNMEYEYAVEAYTGEILYNRAERDR